MGTPDPTSSARLALRRAFGCFTTGVAVATCLDESGGALVGVTINSFVSISLEPPIVAFSLATTARCLGSFLSTTRFAINVLTTEQLPEARNFAKPSLSRWDGIAYRVTDSGHILLRGCAAWFACTRRKLDNVGDHVTLYGDVVDYSADPTAAPLTFWRGLFGSVSTESPGSPPTAGGWDRHSLPWG
jgi:flavin reductase (DIM6/NTAB) family NADH-FMN oxidoreductase RutF